MLSQEQLLSLESERSSFIENGTNASLFQWLGSKGTNFSCYVEYLNKQDNEDRINNTIDIVRTIIYALHKPIQFTFFYWTLLIFILHKFNFKKPVMKILLVHFILRTLGDIVDKFGDLMSHYFANKIETDAQGNLIYSCQYDSPSPEMNPLRWVITRQLGCTLWCFGEIVADWYPLLRTKAVVRDKSSIKFVYAACGLFNLSKILLVLYHFTLSPKELYTSEGTYNRNRVDIFYFTYWLIQLFVIYSSAFYDATVYLVLRKNLSRMGKTNFGFINKFKLISEYRIVVSAIISAVFLPIISLTIIIKYYFYLTKNYHKLEFSFDDIRQSINNFQYFMIFIDQILLLRSKEGTTLEVSNYSNSYNNSSNFVGKSGLNPALSGNYQFKKDINNNLVDYNYHVNESSNNTLYNNSSDTYVNSIFSNNSRNQSIGYINEYDINKNKWSYYK